MDIGAILKTVEASSRKVKVAEVRVGETVKVHYRIKEGNKLRLQIFEGLVIGVTKPKTLQGSFTVRKVIDGVGVERTFPFHSPHIAKLERIKSGKVRRAKLNFVREYALSRRFKLKDKGVAGSVWEEVAKEQQEIAKEESKEEASIEGELGAGNLELDEAKNEPVLSTDSETQSPVPSAESPSSEVAKPEESADNKTDELSGQSAGADGGDASGEPVEEKGIESPQA
ncbi:50S ribosomal protein L19 [Candidatus Berkelbacteria bacterium RIFCSPLOWO2_01_FULL_50_28]|uniref:50S ribosomal protein L19 n=1 Tax=Candidatus Berkelbacteria bacterium RIFCSPLOWO2_01_FULL_50_28 TaxID=1797471 RepID=A0A1F5EBH3_9BACT|nr:MAG: 50S ribosomal protein L19 [Candidatus Berkelbacteria bacterium RIFCSPHIGHO2_01_FULL_50_36]OGD62784.1 MAG: 50S ribosomal protein L19 [Candidatus Berkelbacteria bacterium RIFCSPHIGHO2_12_FULL_50_11]OGD64616.1 MAG: 50S ribosomal protein L19 [Candidatus Berkelbacteria bacterium RIFCSPLOWO2_01_FULL_50_28]